MLKINWVNPFTYNIIFVSNFVEQAIKSFSLFFSSPQSWIKNKTLIELDDFLKLPEQKSILQLKVFEWDKDDNFYIVFVDINDLSKKKLWIVSDLVRLKTNHNYLIVVYTSEKEFNDKVKETLNKWFKHYDIISYKDSYLTSDFIYETKFTPIEERWTLDYCYLLWKWASKKEREKNWAWDIWLNWAVCKHCWDYIRSKNVHDFKMCKCGKIWVDGWSFYVRRIWNPEDYINVVEEFDDV